MASPALPIASNGISAWMVFLLASACGLVAANLYYAQPLISLIAPAIGLHPSTASLIVTLTQMGYCAGLVLLVPLGDLVENRRLILWTLSLAFFALVATAVAQSTPWLLAASLFVGLGSVVVQMLVPIAAHLAPEASRGRVVGNVMSGLLTGVMLARPVSSLIASAFGWRAVFGVSAGLMAMLGLILQRLLPQRYPTADHGYVQLIGSLWILLRDTPLLRRRAAYQAALFAAFSLFWTAVPLVLSGPIFGLTQRGIALFALVGVAGALAAPIAGHLADRGQTRVATCLAIVTVAVSFLLAWIGGTGSLAALLAAAVLLDFGVQANVVLGQRAIYSLGAHIRSRLNGLYITIFFAGGALGSSIASFAYTRSGWELVSWIGFAFPMTALLFYVTEFARE
ncbi:MAG: MFS transporter [Gammaproteobacteria bacterium]|nr:MFS transporter [Gammaproteobacteria bacterium]